MRTTWPIAALAVLAGWPACRDTDTDTLDVCIGSEPMDGYQVGSLALSGDELTIDVSYSGGCESHDFGLCWDESFAESDPPQATVTLHHDANDDPCQAWISEDLVYDLSPIRAAYAAACGGSSDTVVVHLEVDGGAVT